MVASTTIQLTNVTGEKMTLSKRDGYHNFYGNVKGSYPTDIEKDQTIYVVFENQGGDQSSGAVVYVGHNKNGNCFDWLYAWYNENGAEPLKHKAYTEIADANHVWNWDEVQNRLMKSVPISHAEYQNCVSDAIIVKPLCPVIYQGKMSLP